MESTAVYLALKARARVHPRARDLLTCVDSIYAEVIPLLKTIPLYMQQYTLHDEVHVDRVIDLMGRLLPNETLDRLSTLELASLILAASLHDIGMAASADEIAELRNESSESTDYGAFREGYPRVLRRIAAFREMDQHTWAEDLESYLASEYLRREHAARGRRFIFARLHDRLEYDGRGFAAELAQVCESHVWDAGRLSEIPCWELARSEGERCNWRFIAVLLRLADILDFDAKRTPRVLFEHLGIRDVVSLTEWGKHLAVHAWDIAPDRIGFRARCPDPVVEKTVRDFLDQIDRELVEAPAVIARMHHPDMPSIASRYELPLPRRVNRDEVGPVENENGPIYRYVDIDFSLDRDQVVSLVLGVQLYADRSLFLRELLQNAVDACRHRRATHLSNDSLGSYVPKILVRYEQSGQHGLIRVDDNGMGMNERIVKNYLARVGRSYYTSYEFGESRSKAGTQFQPISQFGIGILSTFMAGERLTIDTLHVERTSEPLSIQIEDAGSLFWFTTGTRAVPGTTTSLQLTRPIDSFAKHRGRLKENASFFEHVVHLVRRFALHVEFPIEVECNGETKIVETSWELDTGRSTNCTCDFVKIDLALKGVSGISGKLAIFFLIDADTREFIAEFDERAWELDEDLSDAYTHENGFIQRTVTSILRSGQHETGWSNEVVSEGRWSQFGMSVDCPLFAEAPQWGRERQPVSVSFPFPVHYDLDLSGRFSLPLSADRKNILPTEDASRICDELKKTCLQLMLDELGKERVGRNLEFLEGHLEKCKEPELLEMLAQFEKEGH